MLFRFFGAAACGLALLAPVGCGGGGDKIPRVSVEGEVTLDGEPLETGSITFIPLEQGPSAGASIENGSYEIDAADGPSPGRYRVEIQSAQPTGKKVLGTDGETMVDEYAEVIPDRYNANSELEVDLSADEANAHDFNLTTGG